MSDNESTSKPSEEASSGRTLSTLRMPELTDWSGVLFHKKKEVLNLLYPTCIVRAGVENQETGAIEAIYFEIVKVKDGTLWGKTMDDCRWEDAVGLPDGKVFAFPMRDVIEIPIWRQPKALQRKLGKYLDAEGKARWFTGV